MAQPGHTIGGDLAYVLIPNDYKRDIHDVYVYM